MKPKEIKRLSDEIQALKARVHFIGEELKQGYREELVTERNSLSVDVARLEDRLRRATDNRMYISIDYGYEIKGVQGLPDEV